MLFKSVNMINSDDWDQLVENTYGKIYCFQQQDGCQPRGTVNLTVPDGSPEDWDFENNTIPEEVNGNERGVSFKAWLERDPKQKLNSKDGEYDEYGIVLFWRRNFYPNLQMVANDLYEKGLLPAGEYVIDIDW